MSDYIIWFVCTLILLLGFFLLSSSSKQPKYRKGLMGLYLLFQVVYIYWRFTGTIATDRIGDTFFSSLLILTEVLSFTQTVVFIILFWRKEKEVPSAILSSNFIPSVDIFITTYNEEVDILEQTIVSAQLVDYPKDKKSIYLCDDGNREEMKALADKWSIQYLSRKDHKGAKAGNLNNGLKKSSGEFVVTMDADMKMKPNFLNEVIPLFEDEAMGFVQTPQAFHNPDVIQHNLYVESKVRNDQDFFMRFLQAQKNKFNAVIYVGSNAVFRRKALESVSGFVTDVITEDMATGLLVQNEGWKSAFVNKVLATGLSPETFSELVKQRVRWAKGNVQVFKKYSPRSLKSLSAIQKLLYIDGVHYWFFGIYHFLYLSFPLLSTLLGIQVVDVSAVYFLPIWFVSYMLSNFVFSSVAGKEFRPMWASVGELAIFPSITIGVLKELFFSDTTTFEVTSKGQVVDKNTYNWKMMKTQIVFLILSLISLGMISLKVIVNPVQALSYWALPLFWILYNTVSLIGALHISVDRPRYKNKLISCSATGFLEKDSRVYPASISKIHNEKVIVQVDPILSGMVQKGEKLQLTIESKFKVPVTVLKTGTFENDSIVSLKINDLDKDTYMKLHSFLDQLNTKIFKRRSTDYRRPVYHLTFGYYFKKKKMEKIEQY